MTLKVKITGRSIRLSSSGMSNILGPSLTADAEGSAWLRQNERGETRRESDKPVTCVAPRRARAERAVDRGRLVAWLPVSRGTRKRRSRVEAVPTRGRANPHDRGGKQRKVKPGTAAEKRSPLPRALPEFAYTCVTVATPGVTSGV